MARRLIQRVARPRARVPAGQWIAPGASGACILASAFLLLAAAACENRDAVLGVAPAPPPAGAEISLKDDVQPIFDFNCAFAGCHAGAFPQMGMSLQEADIFDPNRGIVDVASREAPALKRVLPGDSDNSYLVMKIEGTAGSVSSFPALMPFGGPMLPDAEIQFIRGWIDQGAQDN